MTPAGAGLGRGDLSQKAQGPLGKGKEGTAKAMKEEGQQKCLG